MTAARDHVLEAISVNTNRVKFLTFLTRLLTMSTQKFRFDRFFEIFEKIPMRFAVADVILELRVTTV